ncbi:hypothetical protein BDV06DRAFT_194758 [Aspergillus oleicola]
MLVCVCLVFVYSFHVKILLHASDAYMMIHRASRCQDSLCQAETFHVMGLVSPLQESVHCPVADIGEGPKLLDLI